MPLCRRRRVWFCGELPGKRVGAFGPEGGVEVGKDVVTGFNGREAGFLLGGETLTGLNGVEDLFEGVELVLVGVEADFGVVAGGEGADEELPIGRFEQEEFAAELFDDAGGELGFAPEGGGADLAGVKLGGVEDGVGPGGRWVKPDLMVALGSPGSLVHGDGAGGGELLEVVVAGGELDGGGVGLLAVDGAADGLEPGGALEPPVAKVFGVVGGAEDGWGLVGDGGRVECVADEVGEVLGVDLDALGGLLGPVGELVADVDAGAGDLPVAQAAGVWLFC
jgi:hypothetical protein